MGMFNEFSKKEKPIFTGYRFGYGFGGGEEEGPPVPFDGFNDTPATFDVSGASFTITPSWQAMPANGNGTIYTNLSGGRYIEFSVRGYQGPLSDGGGKAGGKIYCETNSALYVRHASGGSSPQPGGAGLVLGTVNSLPPSGERPATTLLVGGGSGGGGSCNQGRTGGAGGGENGSPGNGADAAYGGTQVAGGAGRNGGSAGTVWTGGARAPGGGCASGGGGGGWYGGGGAGPDNGNGGWGGGGGGSGYIVTPTNAPSLVNPTSAETVIPASGITIGNGVFTHGTVLSGGQTFSPSAPVSQGSGTIFARVVAS